MLGSSLPNVRQLDSLVVAEGVVTKTEFEARQQAAGLTLCRNGLLADVELRGSVAPLGSHTYDWMHTYLLNGVCYLELHLCLTACQDAGFKDIYTKLGEF